MKQATGCSFNSDGSLLITSVHPQILILRGGMRAIEEYCEVKNNEEDTTKLARSQYSRPASKSERHSTQNLQSITNPSFHADSTRPRSPLDVLVRLNGLESGVWSACFSRSGYYVVAGAEDTSVYLFDMRKTMQNVPSIANNSAGNLEASEIAKPTHCWHGHELGVSAVAAAIIP